MCARAALALALLALSAGCGSASAASPASVVRAWSKAINRGDNERAARLFAPGAVVIQDGELRLATHADALAWNSALPCAGHISSLTLSGDEVTANFVLGNRPGARCDGPGQRASAVFRIRHGKIVLWHQVPPAGGTTTNQVV